MTIADMAAQMCCSKRKLIYRLEVLKPPRIKHPTWTDERDEYLRAHYPAGVKSAHQIGLDLGLTKNQVIGRAGRLGLRHGIKPEAALCLDADAQKPLRIRACDGLPVPRRRKGLVRTAGCRCGGVEFAAEAVLIL
jgi:hypothetical protein